MTHQLAGLFVKRVCIFWQLPGPRSGTVRATKVCDTEPTVLLVVLVAGAIISFLVLAILYATRNRRRIRAGVVPARPSNGSSNGSSTERTAQPRTPDVPRERAQIDPTRETRRHAYVRLMAFVDNAMAEVDRAMPEDDSVPSDPIISANGEESGKVAAELRAAGSARVRSAYAAWSQTLFRFGFLARDVAEAAAQQLDAAEYADDVAELRTTRSNVYALADGLRRQAAAELMEAPSEATAGS